MSAPRPLTTARHRGEVTSAAIALEDHGGQRGAAGGSCSVYTLLSGEKTVRNVRLSTPASGHVGFQRACVMGFFKNCQTLQRGNTGVTGPTATSSGLPASGWGPRCPSDVTGSSQGGTCSYPCPGKTRARCTRGWCWWRRKVLSASQRLTVVSSDHIWIIFQGKHRFSRWPSARWRQCPQTLFPLSL